MLELQDRIEDPEEARPGFDKHAAATVRPPLGPGGETVEGPTVAIEDVPLLSPRESAAPAVEAAPPAAAVARPRQARLASSGQDLCNPFDLVGVGLAATAAITIILTFASVLGVAVYLTIAGAPR